MVTESSPPSDGPEQAEATEGRDEELFQAFIAKVSHVTEQDHLLRAVSTALRFLLRRPEDKALLDKLSKETSLIIGKICVDQPGPELDAEVRKAGEFCVEILRAAKKWRDARIVREEAVAQAEKIAPTAPAQPQAPGKAQTQAHMSAGPAARQAAASLGAGGHHSSATKHPTSPVVHATGYLSESRRAFWRMPWVWGLALVILAGGASLLAGHRGGPDVPDGSLDEQIEAAIDGEAPATHVFGGALRVTTHDGHLSVVAEAVPSKECAAAAWKLLRTGVVTINGVTPARPSAAKIRDLCYQEKSGAVIIWAPKTTEQ